MRRRLELSAIEADRSFHPSQSVNSTTGFKRNTVGIRSVAWSAGEENAQGQKRSSLKEHMRQIHPCTENPVSDCDWCIACNMIGLREREVGTWQGFSPILSLRGGGADKKRKEARKRKFEQVQEKTGQSPPETGLELEGHTTEHSLRKRRKSASLTPRGAESTSAAEAGEVGGNARDNASGAEEVAGIKSQRFIVFIGNLPFTATDDSISRHFAKVQPIAVRHRTLKDTRKSRGFAFLEFEKYDRMKTCLKLFHHSSFDDGESPVRRLNVELTAGGGGAKSKGRRVKLKEKNGKLNEERKRRAQTEEKQRGKTKESKDVTQASAEEADFSIHPGRRSMVITAGLNHRSPLQLHR